MLVSILEAAFRSAAMAVAVWAAIRLLRVDHVLPQKLAWVLVLAAAVMMPLAMRTPLPALNRVIQIPMQKASLERLKTRLGAATVATQASRPEPLHETSAGVRSSHIGGSQVTRLPLKILPKPPAGHQLAADEIVLPLTDQWETRLAISSSSGESVEKPKAPSEQIMRRVQRRLAAGVSHWLRIGVLLSAIYSAVGLVLLVRALMAAGVAFGVWRRSIPVSHGELQSSLSPGVLDASLRVRSTADLSSPVTIGSTILLPADYRAWEATKLRVVLAHEQSHVRQGDFYLQLAAAMHAAVFWFSPLGWWLQRKLSDLGEALSDQAGLEQAESPAGYAQILLEFAAMPHKPLAGVAMARRSNLSIRIHRILNEGRMGRAFPTGPKHAWLAAAFVPASLLLIVASARFAPAVEAAQGQVSSTGTSQSARQGSSTSKDVSTSTTKSVTVTHNDSNNDSDNDSGVMSSETSDQVTPTGEGQPGFTSMQQSEPAQSTEPAMAPVPPSPPSADVETTSPPEAPDESEIQTAPVPPAPPRHSRGFAAGSSMGRDGEDSFAILSGKDSDVTMSGHDGKEFEKARAQYHNNFIWFERDGKSYVITDPAILAKSEAMFKQDPVLHLRQQDLERMQAKLDAEMKRMQPEIEKASKPGPQFEAQMAQLNKQLAELQSDKFKHLTEQINKEVANNKALTQEAIQQMTQEKLGELQEKIGDIQGRIGEIQGTIGERQGELGEKQGEIGERMGKVGEQMGKIGEEQGRKAEEASRRMKSVLDQAIRDGKAKPVD